MKLYSIAGLAFLTSATTSYGVMSVFVDMDTGTAGIQATRVASPGQSIMVALVMAPGPEGVSSYGISALFDRTELSLDGSPAATEFLPAGFAFNFTAGVALEDNIAGRVLTFEAGTLMNGPVTGSFEIGTIAFTVPAVFDDGPLDITPGYFNPGVDGAFDNSGAPVVATFVGGSVIPEPAALGLLATALLPLAGGRRGRGPG